MSSAKEILTKLLEDDVIRVGPNERERFIEEYGEVMDKIHAMESALIHVKRVVDNSDEWWMSSPNKGGIDVDIVDDAIEHLEEIA